MIVQDDAFAERDSITLCPLTSDPADAPVFRIPVEPSSRNALSSRSWRMVDKLSAVSRERLGSRIGSTEAAATACRALTWPGSMKPSGSSCCS